MHSNIILKYINNLKINANFKILPSLRFEYYLTLLKNSQFIIGNSSSGIMEAPYYGVTTINIGNRQSNRLKTKLIKNQTPKRRFAPKLKIIYCYFIFY